MFKRAVSAVLILVLVPQLTGCTSVKSVNLTDVEPGSAEVYGVITVDGQQVDFDEPTTDIRNDSIYATVDHRPYAIALDDVQQLRLKRSDTGEAIVILIVFVAVVGAAVVSSVNPGPIFGSGG